MQSKSVVAIVLAILTLTTALLAQQSPQRTTEQTISALQYQWQVLFVGAILNGRDNGQDPRQVGTGIGRWVAKRWGANLEPGFGADMSSRLQLMGFRTELIENNKEMVTFRWTGPDPNQFTTRYGTWGPSLADLQTALTAWMAEMASQGGLVWDQHSEGEWLVARVTKRR